MMAAQLLDRVQANIAAITSDATSPTDARLFEQAELALPENISSEQTQQLVASLATLLPQLQQDPTALVTLLIRLIHGYSYNQILQLGTIPFTDGLAVGENMVAFNKLILTVLQKGATSAVDAASIAGMLDTVRALVRLWLCTTDIGVATQASQLLLDLLRVDQEVLAEDLDAPMPTRGQGLVWKRIFGDQDVYRTFFEACSLSGPSLLEISKSQRSLAQARLLEWLPQVAAMNWNIVTKSQHDDIESQYGVQGGVLNFAALTMVDCKDDVLMYRCLIDFFSDLLRRTQALHPTAPTTLPESLGLEYLISHGLHVRTAAIYLQLPGQQVDPLEVMFLYGPAANYVATYASQYPQHFLASQLPKQVLARLASAFDRSGAQWAHAESPKHDLHVLASVPRHTLLPSTDPSRDFILTLLPSRVTNADVLHTLATIFYGPQAEITVTPASSLDNVHSRAFQDEADGARTLYYHYIASNPRFWSDIATHADTVALQDLALAALRCLHSVITAQWHGDHAIEVPAAIATPATGHLAILAPPALEATLPFLLKPPRTFANLVGGRGDAESAAYKIAAAKFDALQALHRRLETEVDRQPGQGFEEILTTIGSRLARGAFSREGEVGGRIDTMEL